VSIASQVVVAPARRIAGAIRVPGDKSISHRYALLAALADGRSSIRHYAPGADCASTLECLARLGVAIDRSDVVVIQGRGLRGLQPPTWPLDCGNSGSTMRMLAGVLAAHSFTSVLTGDASLSRRPMRRVMTPLERMGATLEAAPGGRPPLTVRGAELSGIDYEPDVPSAQVKSAVLLAGLQARGISRVTERTPTRDHTERALAAFGVHVERDGQRVAVRGGQRLTGRDLRVPGDISSAAFLLAAAAALPGSEITIDQVGLNPTRTAILDVLRRYGADVAAEQTEEWQGEPVGRIRLRAHALGRLEIGPAEAPHVIDELPVLGALATCGGEIRVTGASELRVKESDRISALVTGLRGLGAEAEELPDGFHVRGTRQLTGGTAHAQHDHRLAMAFAIAALAAAGPVAIDGADAATVSYPSFFDDLDRLRA
jgi:3-phosphoshikimate 1-carboxyvinyltransferase